jgi:glycerate kinase
LAAVRIVVVVDAFGPELGADAAAEAIVAGWHAAAPDARLIVVAPSDGRICEALDEADLLVTGGAVFDWQALRDSLVTEVAGAAVARGVPCVVLAGQVSVGRREAAAVGVDAAYAPGGAAGISRAALVTLAERVARRWNR